MSSTLQKIVQSQSLIYTSKKAGLPEHILVGRSCKVPTDSIIEDVYESFIGAVYLEFGGEEARKILKNTLWKNFLNKELNFATDFKTLLQEEVIKKYKVYPEYRQLSGEDSKNFTVGVYWNSEIKAQGSSKKLKSAEKIAAKLALEKYFKKFR